jgi:hypothetical protein
LWSAIWSETDVAETGCHFGFDPRANNCDPPVGLKLL